jgi:hypothetical protein
VTVRVATDMSLYAKDVTGAWHRVKEFAPGPVIAGKTTFLLGETLALNPWAVDGITTCSPIVFKETLGIEAPE